jgi:tetratricopeptide (TPR) repeat protein
MSFFRKLLGGAKSVEEIRALSDFRAGGDPRRALAAARRLATANSGDSRVEELVAHCEHELISQSLARADAATEEGHVDDALEWIEIARTQLSEVAEPVAATLRGEVDRRGSALQGQKQSAAAESLRAELHGAVAEDADTNRGEDEDHEEDGEEVLFEEGFAALLDTLREEVAREYEELASIAEFRQAVVAVNEGEGGIALPLIEGLPAAVRSRPAVLLEEGRARLLAADHGGAKRALQEAMDAFGEGAIDHQGALHLLALWAEAALAVGAEGEVVERLRESAAESPTLAELYVDALLQLGERTEALENLRGAAQRFPMQPEFHYRLALLLTEEHDHPAAVAVLEERIEIGMRPGASRMLHPASVELLCEHLLQEGERRALRIHELLDVASHLYGGTTANVAWLRSRILELEGRTSEAAAAADVARTLFARLQEREEASGPGVALTHRLVLVELPA